MPNTTFNDNDQLNIAGDWDIFYRNNIDPNFTFPPGHTQPPLRAHLKVTENGPLGQRFTGKVTTPNVNQFEFQGETLYLKEGRQVVQFAAIFKPLQWVQVHAGQHQPITTTDGKEMIVGVAMDRGGPLAGAKTESPAGVSFKMVRVRTK